MATPVAAAVLQFTFVDQTNVPLSTTITSAAVTITGIAAPAAISVTGGTYSIGCGATFTSAIGSISNGQTVCVRHTSAATASTVTNTVLTVGGVADTFTSRTGIIGTSGPDTLTGTAGYTLDGRGGADVMTGLGGNDTYYVDLTTDQVVEALNEGTDLVRSTVTYTLPVNVENLLLLGTLPLNGTGNTLANTLYPSPGNNVLNGGGGDRKSVV